MKKNSGKRGNPGVNFDSKGAKGAKVFVPSRNSEQVFEDSRATAQADEVKARGEGRPKKATRSEEAEAGVPHPCLAVPRGIRRANSPVVQHPPNEPSHLDIQHAMLENGHLNFPMQAEGPSQRI